MASGGPGTAEKLRASLQPLVAENRALLSPSGPAGRALLEYRDAWRQVRQKLDSINQSAKAVEPLQGPPGADGALERIQSALVGWQPAARMFQPWCLWRNVRDQAIAQGLQGVVSGLEDGAISLSKVHSHFEFSYRIWWLKKTIDKDPILRAFSSADHERKIREFRTADERFQKLTEGYIAAILSGRIPSTTGLTVGADSEMGRLRREMQRQRGHMPVRQLVKGLPSLLPKLKPCLLMSPLSVAQYLDAGYAPFDVVVFDEASQIPVWDAVGAIARGKQIVVVGHPKQLPPTNFFNKSTGADGDGADDGQVEDLESILDECLGAGMNRLSLQWHYRSRHESLITFSNVNYYESKLVTFPSPVTDDMAVRFERVYGVYDRGGSRTNRAEAEAIVAGIETHYLAPGKQRLSLGVVTFNQPQQVLIETLLDARRRVNANLDSAIAARSNDPLFIKNLENVQGDERDVIFFSITFGPDAAGKMTMNFGPLNGEGGHRRLNVAISRAREGVVIYSTLLPEQIDLARGRAAAVRDLKHYLEFALKGPRALVEQSVPTGLEPDSPFELAVLRVLRDRNWTVHPQVGCSGYRIDIGVVDPSAPGRYLVGIECDGRAYHSGATARDRDRLRQHVLEGLGWRIHRIWSTDWWMNPDGEIQKITNRLQSHLAVDKAAAASAATMGAVEPEDSDTGVDASESDDTNAQERRIPAEQQTQPNIEPTAYPVYQPVELPPGNPAKFYESASNRALAEHLHLVIEAEGPVSETVLFRRIARAWGLERTGARIVERLRSLVPLTTARTTDGDTTFYWPGIADPASWRNFRVASGADTSRRTIYEVCIEEISALVMPVLHHGGSAPREDIARSVCRLVGMARTPAEAELRVGAAIDRLIALGDLTESNGCVRESG